MSRYTLAVRESLPGRNFEGGRRVRTPIVPLLAAALAIAGCAKKSYVQREVGEVNQKVDAVSVQHPEADQTTVWRHSSNLLPG